MRSLYSRINVLLGSTGPVYGTLRDLELLFGLFVRWVGGVCGGGGAGGVGGGWWGGGGRVRELLPVFHGFFSIVQVVLQGHGPVMDLPPLIGKVLVSSGFIPGENGYNSHLCHSPLLRWGAMARGG